MNSAISTMNMRLRPKWSDRPPSKVAPTRMPSRLAAATMPCSNSPRFQSLLISGKATPVMNTTMPSKNLPAAASAQISHCMRVIGVMETKVPSSQRGVSSIYC